MKKKTKQPAPTTYDPAESPLLAFMRNHKIPLTREEYLNLHYLGNVPDKIPAEEEMEFPRQFQLNLDPEDDADYEE
jgi:hypothetical protein